MAVEGPFLLAPFASLVLQVDRIPSNATSASDPLARAALMNLRSDIESNTAGALETAIEILTLLGDDRGLAETLASAARTPTEAFKVDVVRGLEEAFLRGQLRVDRSNLGIFHERERVLPNLPPLPPARRDTSGDSFFEVRFVDEIGAGLPGLRTSFTVDAQTSEATTNGAGMALLEPAPPKTAAAFLAETTELENLLDKRWDKLRPGQPPRESNTTEMQFTGAPLPPVFIKPAVSNTVIVKPQLGKVHLRLVDKRDRSPHAARPYTLSGPVQLAGTTDERGELLQTGLPYADFTLTLQLDDGPVVAAVLTLDPDAPIQTRRLGVAPYVELAELRGLFFATNKSFLLPATMAVFERIRRVYERNTPSKLLIVGHTDTTAEPRINDPLSLERAKNTLAFLADDVDAWLKMYETSVAEGRRWGAEEDEAMIIGMPDSDSILPGEDLVRWFQRTRNLDVDGVAGPKTRRELITEYMRLDGVSLNDPGIEIDATVHGCGENFPLDSSQQSVDAVAPDDFEDQGDRRVELFFFDPDFGIQPPPPGPNSKPGDPQYPKWRAAAAQHELADTAQRTVKIRCVDELGQPVPNLAARLLTDDGRTFAATLDAAGLLSVFVGTETPCSLFLTGIDETALSVAASSIDEAVTAATLTNEGVEILPGVVSVVQIGLGELSVLVDDDDDDESASVQVTLQADDGSFSQNLQPSVDGTPVDGGIQLLFRGLATLSSTFTLSVKHADGDDTLLASVAFADLQAASADLAEDQVEPTLGGEDGRISLNADDDTGPDLDTGTAIA